MRTHLSSPTTNAAASLGELEQRLTGYLILPGDERYQEARQIRGFVNNRFPSFLVRAQSPEDVAETVRFARRHGLPFSVKGGGHSIAGYTFMDGAVAIDMSEMNAVSIDPVAQTARVQGGARSIDLGIPAHEHGLALSTGDTGSVGLGGLVTGGGIGFFVRQYGLAADRLLSARVVTADGELVSASPMENSDLFWAIRGGGGNFGIVVEFEFQLVPVKTVVGGALVLPATREVVRGYLEYSASAPDGLSTMGTITHAPPAPFIPEERVGESVLLILAAWVGDPAEADAAYAPLRALAEPVADTIAEIPYPAIFQYMEWAEAPHGHSIRMMFADEFPDSAIDDSLDAIENASSPVSGIHFRGLGGQLARIPEESAAFAHRQRRYFVAVLGIWFEREDDADVHRAWTEEIWSKIAYLREGVYVNFLEQEGQGRVKEAYPDAIYRRLAEVKAKWDPDNVFHFNQNVRPAVETRQAAA
jgi:FAD/FMN-containing dehydrogenase